MANRRYIDFPIASTSGDTDIILIWQDGANKQTTKATFLSGLPENLEDLNDVVISGLTNGQILRYDSVTGKWENTDQGNLDLNDLNDVSIVSPSNGQVLVYNSSTSKWENSSGGFVPYVGAVTTVDLGAQGLRAGYVRFDTTVAGVPNEQGLMFWDADDETVDIILNGYTMKIGEDLFYPVKNQTGSTIAKGVAVRFNGTVGASGRLLIAPFIADGSVPSSRFMGVTAEEILNGEDGKVLYFGRVRGINTSAFSEGDILYASTTVAGGYQTAIPVAPNNIVQVAAVISSHASNGTIFVRPTLGSNINKDEGVKIVSVADKNLLQYQSGTSLWENKSLAQVLGGTSAQFVKGDGSLDSTSYGTGTVTSVGLSSATSGVTIGGSPVTTSGTITLAIATASGSQNGLLSSSDWSTFNNKQNALTNPVTGTGTTNYLPKFTGSTTIGNSLFTDNGTNAGYNNAGVAARTFIVQATSGRPLALEVIENANVHAIYLYPNNSGFNRISSDYMSGGTFLPLSLTGRENNADLVCQTSGNITIGTTTDNGARLQVSASGGYFNVDTNGQIISAQSLDVATAGGRLTGMSSRGALGAIHIEQTTTGANGGYIAFRTSDAGSTTPTEKMRIASNGAATFSSSVNIGASATTGKQLIVNQTGATGYFLSGEASGTEIAYWYYNSNVIQFSSKSAARALTFLTTDTERMTITSIGDVLMGKQVENLATAGFQFRAAAAALGLCQITRDNSEALHLNRLSSDGSIQVFFRQTVAVGSISVTGSATSYNTSSDYRLKEDLQQVNGLEKINAINVYNYKWKNSNDRMDGVLAHELAEVLPYAVIGQKDGIQMQGVDYSKIVPLLIQSIKELKQEIDTLKN